MLRSVVILLSFICLYLVKAAHDDAFIGYEEKSVKCEDSKEGCDKWEKSNQCIENAYYMREHCKKVRPTVCLMHRAASESFCRHSDNYPISILLPVVLRSAPRVQIRASQPPLGRHRNS